MPIAATSRRALSKTLRPARAEPSLASGVVFDGTRERDRAEIGPQKRTEEQFGVGGFPEQEVTQPQFARGADDQIRLAHVRSVHVGRDDVLVDLVRREPRTDGPSDRVDDLLTPPVVEGYEQIE